MQKAVEDFEKEKTMEITLKDKKNVDEPISDSILDIGYRGHFETHS
ncbi:hypothetical protein [Bartonella sp. CM120XJJH]